MAKADIKSMTLAELQQFLAELGEAVLIYTERAKREQIEIIYNEPEMLPILYGDKNRLKQVFINIIDNAIKYTPAGGSVRVSVEVFQLFCAIVVEDTGPGIAEQEHAKIFTRFYRSPDMAAAPGVGIGLYLTREILHKQNGYVKLCSKLGQGAKFYAFLPRDI